MIGGEVNGDIIAREGLKSARCPDPRHFDESNYHQGWRDF